MTVKFSRAIVGIAAAVTVAAPSAAAKQPWYGTYAHAYRASSINRRTRNQASIAREYHVHNSGFVALRWAQHTWRSAWQQPAFEGCLDSFMHVRPKVVHVQPWRP